MSLSINWVSSVLWSFEKGTRRVCASTVIRRASVNSYGGISTLLLGQKSPQDGREMTWHLKGKSQFKDARNYLDLWRGETYQSVQSHWAGDNGAGPSLAYPLLSSGQHSVLVSKTLLLLERNKTRRPDRGKVSGIWKLTINWQLIFWSPFDQHFSFESSRSCYNFCVSRPRKPAGKFSCKHVWKLLVSWGL